MENKISFQISDEESQTVETAIKSINDTLSPKCIVIPSGERRNMLHLGPKSIDFTNQAFELAKAHPELIPPFIDLQELQVDLAAHSYLRHLKEKLDPINQLIEDSMDQAGSEAYQAALQIYNQIKSAKTANVPGAKAMYEDLSRRFTQAKKNKPEENVEE